MTKFPLMRKSCSVNIFKFGKEEKHSNEYQCLNFELKLHNYIELGNQIAIYKGTPIICMSELIGFVAESIYEKGELVIEKIQQLDDNDFVEQKADVFEEISRGNVDGYNSLRKASIFNLFPNIYIVKRFVIEQSFA